MGHSKEYVLGTLRYLDLDGMAFNELTQIMLLSRISSLHFSLSPIKDILMGLLTVYITLLD